MQDVIIYQDAKQAAEALAFAERLGTEEAIVLFLKHDKANDEAFAALRGLTKMTLRKGILVKDTKDAQRCNQHYDALFGLATRDLVESRLVTHIYGAETLEDKDKTHRRGSGMNQVIAKLLADKGKTYLFDLSLLFSRDQAKVLGRMAQNKRILKKYSMTMLCCSFAVDWLGVRAPKERVLFLDQL